MTTEETLNECQDWYHKMSGEVSTKDCFKFAIQQERERILKIVEKIKFDLLVQYRNRYLNNAKFEEFNIIIDVWIEKIKGDTNKEKKE